MIFEVLKANAMDSSTADGIAGGAWDHVVCPPSCKNIIYMYKPMLHFVEEMEDAQDSPLHSVLKVAVGNFLGTVNEELEVSNGKIYFGCH